VYPSERDCDLTTCKLQVLLPTGLGWFAEGVLETLFLPHSGLIALKLWPVVYLQIFCLNLLIHLRDLEPEQANFDHHPSEKGRILSDAAGDELVHVLLCIEEICSDNFEGVTALTIL
jgi:hypothetical protein